MTVTEAQRDIRRAYVGGGPGAFVSGIVWFAAGAVLWQHGTTRAFAVLFVGGMLIFPAASALCRFLFRREPTARDNPLGSVALESTIGMIGGLIAAWLFLSTRPVFVFPIATIAVGTHYAAFRTAYGDVLFWLLGGLVSAIGMLTIYGVPVSPIAPVLLVGAVELLFGIILTWRALHEARN